MENQNLESIKKQLIETINKKLEDKIIEQSNADLIIKLINSADTVKEAVDIAALGTTYKKTGFHFDKRLDKIVNNGRIKYFKKNNELSFSDGSDKPVNKLIIGDNFDALQNLLIQYKNSIDVIYIDPPYGKDSMGQFAETNYNNALTRDNLLSMLYPRLVLAKELLSDDGVIFCSIDDRNQAYVKCLFDEVFEEANFISMPVRRKNKLVMKGDNTFKNVIEPLIVYAKDKKNIVFSYTKDEIVDSDFSLISSGYGEKTVEFQKEQFRFIVESGVIKKGVYGNITINNDFQIENYVNTIPFSATGEFKWSEKKIQEKLSKNAYVLVKNINSFSARIHFVGNSAKPLDYIDEEYGKVTNEDGKNDLKRVFNNIEMFDYPKPIDFIKFILNISDNENALVLDFFAGSGTTGQAVLEMNEKDEGNRQFILVQLPEDLDILYTKNKKSEILKNQIELCDLINRKHLLSEITAERLRRVMKGSSINGEISITINKRLGGSLDVYEIADVANNESTEGQSPFDVIDETLYGKEKFTKLQDKIEWVCSNFENCQKELKE